MLNARRKVNNIQILADNAENLLIFSSCAFALTQKDKKIDNKHQDNGLHTPLSLLNEQNRARKEQPICIGDPANNLLLQNFSIKLQTEKIILTLQAYNLRLCSRINKAGVIP